MRFCKNCGRFAADPAMTHCPKCGTPLPPEPPRPVSAPPQEGPDAARTQPLYQNEASQSAMSTAEYFFTLLVFSIPVVGLILQLVWSFSAQSSLPQRNLSRAYLLRKLIFGVVAALFAVVCVAALVSWFSSGVSSPAMPYYW